jgi:DNA mismatch repair protein MutS
LLEPWLSNFFGALVRQRTVGDDWLFAVAAVEISTGAPDLFETDKIGLPGVLARLDPREIVAADAVLADEGLATILKDFAIPLSILGYASNDPEVAESKIKDYFGVTTLDGFGALTRVEINAAAAALTYVEQTQKTSRPRLSFPNRAEAGRNLQIDASTRIRRARNRTISGGRSGSFISVLDRTTTPAGARMLASWLAGPLREIERIGARQDAVAFFAGDSLLRKEIRSRLKRAPDMPRALARLALNRGGPRDLAVIRDGLFAARDCGLSLMDVQAPSLLAQTAAFLSSIDLDLAEELATALEADLPVDRRNGDFIRTGYHAGLDEARNLRDESRKVIAGLQGQYCELAETRQLKIKHNNFLGFFIEVSQAQGEKLLRPPYNGHFIHRQTMAGAMRFSTNELSELEGRIANAADEALAIEKDLFEQIAATRQKFAGEI